MASEMGAFVSPVPSSGRRAALLLGIALLATLAIALPAGAQDNTTAGTDGNATGAEANATGTADNATGTDGATGGDGAAAGGGAFAEGGMPPTLAEGNFIRHFSLKSLDDDAGCAPNPAPCWDVNTLVVHAGDNVVIHADLSSGSHDVSVPSMELKSQSPVAFTDFGLTIPDSVPEEGVEYVCSIHPDSMVGTFKLESALGAQAPAANTLGVHFLAYWVGVIAFAILFVVYGATFFLFKYNETRATTDHWDRSEPGRENKRLAAVAPLLAVFIAIAAISAIVYISR